MKTMSEAITHLKFHLGSSRNLQKVPALVGLTGIGKTAIVKKVADELGFNLIYFNMAQLSEGDMALPALVKENNENAVIYAINHKLKEALENPNEKYLIMVDEFTRATVPVISEWMTIINERQIQGNKFSDNVRFVSAMNPTSSMKGFQNTDYVANEMDDAHSNRFTFLHVEANVNDWLDWAKEEGDIHPLVISFLSNTNNRRHFYGKETEGIRMRTPRSWEFLSDSLKDMEEQDLLTDSNFLYQVVSDQIGEDMGLIFEKFSREMLSAVEYEDIISDKPIKDMTVKNFDRNNDNMKKSIIDGFISRIAEEKPEMTDLHVQNFLKLWKTIKSTDIKYAISYQIANELFDFEKEDDEEKMRYNILFHTADVPESKEYHDFVEEQFRLTEKTNIKI